MFQKTLQYSGEKRLKMRTCTSEDWLWECCNISAGMMRQRCMFKTGSFLCDVNYLEQPGHEERSSKRRARSPGYLCPIWLVVYGTGCRWKKMNILFMCIFQEYNMREESERDVIQLYFINTCAQQKKSLADKSLNVGLSGGEENSDKFNYLKYLREQNKWTHCKYCLFSWVEVAKKSYPSTIISATTCPGIDICWFLCIKIYFFKYLC